MTVKNFDNCIPCTTPSINNKFEAGDSIIDNTLELQENIVVNCRKRNNLACLVVTYNRAVKDKKHKVCMLFENDGSSGKAVYDDTTTMGFCTSSNPFQCL